MTGTELAWTYALRRRRLMGLGVFAGLVLVSAALGGWRPTPIWTLFENDEGTFAAGDPFGEWVYAVCDGETQQITVLRDGRVAGAEALGSLGVARFPNWCDLPVVDNPDLAAWQAASSRLRALTGAQASSASEILAVAREMPVSAMYLKPISEWIRDDAAHAVDFLDAVAGEGMRFDGPNAAVARARRDNFARLIDEALDGAAGVAPDKIGTWLTASLIGGSGRALRKLATIEGASDGVKAAILERLETVHPQERGYVYRALAPALVHDASYAALLNRELERVPLQGRVVAVRELLARPDASVQFSKALLADFRGRFGHPDAQLEVFTAIANKLKSEREAPLLLSMHLKDIDGLQRRLAATQLLAFDEDGETAYAMGVLGTFSEFHPMSRPKVVYTIMQSPQFRDRVVQEACLLAVQLQMRGSERHELLSAMLRHERLDEALAPRISAELGMLASL